MVSRERAPALARFVEKARSDIGKITLSQWGLIAAVLGGALLRFVHLESIPPGINQDEAVTGYDAWSIWETGRDHHGHPFPFWVIETFGDWSSPLLTFLTAPFVGIFGPNFVVVRSVTALLGVLMIVAVYGLARELTNRSSIALAAAVLAAVSPWAVHYSRYALLPITAMALGPLTLWCALAALRKRNGHALVAAGALAGLTMLGYHTLKLYVPLLGLVFVLLFWRDVLKMPRWSLVYSAIVTLFLMGPSLFMTLRDPEVGSRNNYLSITSREDFGLRLLLEQYWSYTSPEFLFQHGDGDATHTMPGYGMEFRFLAPPLVIGIGVMIWRLGRPASPLSDRRRNALLLLAMILAPLPGALTQFQAANRATTLVPLLAIVGGIGFVSAADGVGWLTDGIERTWRWLAIGAIAVGSFALAGMEVVDRYQYYFREYPSDYGATWGFHDGLLEAIEVAVTYEDEVDEIWIADANQPYIFLLFGQHIPPEQVQGALVDTDPSPIVWQVSQYGKYHFGDNYAGPPDWLPIDDLQTVFTSEHEEGAVYYEVRVGTLDDGRRVALVHSPNR
jgi:4-amino-4-deoxy-L-arabinose transferase-like glycosyltransferase